MALGGAAGFQQRAHRGQVEEETERPGRHALILIGCYAQKVKLRAAAALFVSGSLGLGLAAGAQEDPRFEGETVDVSLSTIVVRAVDTWGAPILDLKPEDFRVRAGKKEIPVAALDWVSGEEPPPPASAAPSGEEAPAPAPAPSRPGRMVVFFVQADLNPTRISGQLRLRPHTRGLLDTLTPADRVAVVSYDSHLKLWQDFTRDHEKIYAALDRAMLYSKETEIAPEGPESLAGHFDYEAARKAASPERALELTAQALKPFPGEKTLIFLGWGLGRFGGGGVDMVPAYRPAVRTLAAAHASVFVLDVTSADSHSLEVGLQNVADATGGIYLKTFRLPGLATRTLAKAISGYYVLTLDTAQLSGAKGLLEIELRDGRRGTVISRPAVVR
jgi:VWFA-related protein